MKEDQARKRESWGAFAAQKLTRVSLPSRLVRSFPLPSPENHRETRLHPCLHAGLCTKCATGLCKQNMGCPLCGAAIEHVEFGKFDSTFAFDDASRLTHRCSHKPKSKEAQLTVPEGAVPIY